MKSKSRYFFLLIIVILALHCGKKEKEEIKNEVIVPYEMEEVKVNMPRVSWKKSLAVLTKADEGITTDDKILEEMVTKGITSNVSRTGDVKIVSPSMAGWMEGEKPDVDYVMMSDIQRQDDGVRVAMNLVDVRTDSTLWEEVYDGEIETLHAMENNAAASVAKALGIELEKGKARSASIPPDAVKAYMEGFSYLKGDSREQIDLAVQKFKEVLRMDTTYIQAYLALTDAYLKIVNNEWDRNPVWLQLAQDAAQKALQMDEESAEGYLRLGNIYLLRGDFKHADEKFRTALQYDTNLEYGWVGLGKVFNHFGLYYPCLEAYEKALSLNPKNFEVAMSRAMILTGLRQYGKAEEEILKAIRYKPRKVYLYSFLALVQYYSDDLEDAERNVQIGIKSQEYLPFSHAVLAMIYAKRGRLDEALAEVELEVKPFVGNDASLASAVAAVYSLLGRYGQAIQWLEKAVSWGYGEYPWLLNDPNFKGMRRDERYVKILNDMKEAWEYNTRQYPTLNP